MKNLTSKNGFTLIEIIIVLIILGILVLVCLPFLFSNIAKSRAHEAFQNISSFRPSIEACIIKEGSNQSCKSILNDSENFTYQLKINQGAHEKAYSIIATGQNNLTSNDIITFTSDVSLFQTSCTSQGQLNGVC